jgi:hypothetical protein
MKGRYKYKAPLELRRDISEAFHVVLSGQLRHMKYLARVRQFRVQVRFRGHVHARVLSVSVFMSISVSISVSVSLSISVLFQWRYEYLWPTRQLYC